jgi:hypothetical protein
MSKFEELLAQLNAEQEAQDTLAKALPQDSQDDATIQAAAEEGHGEGDGEGEGEGDADGEGEGEGEGDLAKSLTLADGEEVIDATELLKSMQANITEQGDVLAKALPQVLQLVQGQSKMIQQQGELIKSMQTRIDQLAGQGRGRKTVVTVQEKTAAGEQPLAKSQPDGITPQEFMLKANSAFEKGVINGTQLTTIDVCLRQGAAIDPALLHKVANS